MTVQTYTDLFNEALTDLETNIAALTDLVVVTDPRNLAPPCAFIDAPRFDCWSSAIAKVTFPVRLISLGPNNLDAHRNLLNLSAQLMNAGLGVTDGRPTVAIIGGVELPAYDLNISVQAQA